MELISLVLVSGKQYLKIQFLSLYRGSENRRTIIVFLFSISICPVILAKDGFSYLVNYTIPEHGIPDCHVPLHVCYSGNIMVLQDEKTIRNII